MANEFSDAKSFVINLTRQLNLKNMDDARRAKLDDLKKQDVATDTQAGWDPDADIPTIKDVDTTKFDYESGDISLEKISEIVEQLNQATAIHGDPDVQACLNNYNKIGQIQQQYDDLKQIATDLTAKINVGKNTRRLINDFSTLVNQTQRPNNMVEAATLKPSVADLHDALTHLTSIVTNLKDEKNWLSANHKISVTQEDFDDLYLELENIATKFADSDDNDVKNFIEKLNALKLTSMQGSILHTLYEKLSFVFRDLAADKELKEDKKVQKFLSKYYGDGNAIAKFESINLDPQNAKELAQYINSNSGAFKIFFKDKIQAKDLKSLAEKLEKNTYASDAKAINTLDTFLSEIAYYSKYASFSSSTLPTKDFPACLGANGTVEEEKVVEIQEKINKPQVPQDLDTFEKALPKIFGELVSSSELREKFVKKDSDGDISQWIAKGIEKSDYENGKHALSRKYTDRQNMWKRAQTKVKDFYVDTLGKLKQKHTRHTYKTKARLIVAELIKKGVKPTDGTEKLLSTLDAINDKLPNPVQEQLGWIKKTMNNFSDKDFFKEALRDGDQMNKLVSHIITAAAHDGKLEAAEVALEMLAVMRYTMTSSSVRDKLKETEFKLLSDPNLSINKNNKFMQGLTGAIDSTIKFTMMGAFELGNLAKNAIKQQGLRFGKGQKGAGKTITESKEYQDAERRFTMDYLMGFWNFVNSSGNTKDYFLFRKHSNVQKKADAKDDGKTVVTLDGHTETIDNKTAHNKQFLEYLKENNIGRAA